MLPDRASLTCTRHWPDRESLRRSSVKDASLPSSCLASLCQQEDGPRGSLAPEPPGSPHLLIRVTAVCSPSPSQPQPLPPFWINQCHRTGGPSPVASAELACQPPAALSLSSSRQARSLGSPKVSPVWSRAEECWLTGPNFPPSSRTV